MSAIELLGRLQGIDAGRLAPLQRVLLITDGTLTEILEAYLLEPIELVKISERVVTGKDVNAPLLLEPQPTGAQHRVRRR